MTYVIQHREALLVPPSAKGTVKEGSLMYYHKTTSRGESFSLLLTPFLQAPGLPFAGVLSEGQIEKAFADESVCFGKSQRSVYSPVITLWAFLSQAVNIVR